MYQIDEDAEEDGHGRYEEYQRPHCERFLRFFKQRPEDPRLVVPSVEGACCPAAQVSYGRRPQVQSRDEDQANRHAPHHPKPDEEPGNRNNSEVINR